MPHDLAFTLHDLIDPATLLGALLHAVVIALGAWLAGRAVSLAVQRALEGPVPRADPTAVKFLGQLARLAIYVLALLSYAYEIPALRQLGGVWLTSVGVVSVVVGIAAQSTLGNLISGVALLLYRPFRIGDRLQVMTPAGLETGVVECLGLGYTTLQTPDHRRIVIPNSVMASQTCVNLTLTPNRAPAVITVNLGNTADIDKARLVLTELARAQSQAVDEPSCRVSAFSASGTTLTLTAWCTDAAAAAEMKSDLLEAARKRLDAERIPIA